MPELHPRKAERSVTLLNNLLLPAAVIGLSTVALETGQFDTFRRFATYITGRNVLLVKSATR